MQAIPSDENNPLRMEKKISFDITTKHLKHLLSIAILCSLVLFINCGEDSENPQGETIQLYMQLFVMLKIIHMAIVAKQKPQELGTIGHKNVLMMIHPQY